jgi:hypothetical protein
MMWRSIILGIGGLLSGSAGITAAQPQPAVERVLIDTPAVPAGYARLLGEGILRLPRPDGGFDTRFDYAALARRPGSREWMATLRSRFLEVDPSAMDDATRRAWALNAYNFLVIDLVLDYRVGVDGDPLESIRDIGRGNFAVFDEPRIPVAGERLSLNAFEHRYLFLDVDRASHRVPAELDPRHHFALVCAAKGCPPLWPEPFLPETLAEQLDRATRNALASPAQVQLEGRVLRVSRIFDWYAIDFERYGGIQGFLRRYAPPEVAARLEDPRERITIRTDLEWDWSLNRP